jgi:hypothetical protein
MRLYPSTFKGGLLEAERGAVFSFGNNPAQSLFHQGFQGRTFLPGYLAGFLKKVIGYLKGCFHMGNHLITELWLSIHEAPLASSSRR